jgi:dipeptidyl aminopeptidase/acylaminoacyl peptidase
MMDSNWAIYNIAPIKGPILLIHGTYDTQVRTKQSRDFCNKAKRARVDIEYLELAKGTHYFDEFDNRLAVFAAPDEFPGKHL